MGLIHFRTNRLLHLDLSPPERCIMHSRPEQKGKKCPYAHVPIHRAPYGVITEADRLDLFWFGDRLRLSSGSELTTVIKGMVHLSYWIP